MPDNEVTINVKHAGSRIDVTVNRNTAHARKGEPIIWHVHPDADVDEVEIHRKGGKWPFTEAPPYTSKKNNPKNAHQRRADWVPGGTAQYAIRGTCKGQTFVLDPDMIVD